MNTNLPEPGELSDDALIDLICEHLGLTRRRGCTLIDQSTGRYTDQQRYTELLRAGIAADRAQRVTGLDPDMGFLLDGANAGELAAYDYAVTEHCAATLAILSGKDNGDGACNEPWASVRKQLLELAAQRVKVEPASAPGAVQYLHDGLVALLEKCRVGYTMSKSTRAKLVTATKITEALCGSIALHSYPQADKAPSVQGVEVQPSVVPAELDVRKIFLGVVPGDGDGYEVYAKSVKDVEDELSRLGWQLEEWVSGTKRFAAPAPVAQVGEAVADDKIIDLVCEHLGLNRRRDATVVDPRTGRYCDQQRYIDLGRAILATQQPAPVAGEPVIAWAVYWGIGEMRKNSVHFEKASADEAASCIKSNTEVRPLVFQRPVASEAAHPLTGDADLWKVLLSLPGARRRIWNHVLDDAVKGKHNTLESALFDHGIGKETP